MIHDLLLTHQRFVKFVKIKELGSFLGGLAPPWFHTVRYYVIKMLPPTEIVQDPLLLFYKLKVNPF